MQKTFYNTAGLTGDALKEAVSKAERQEDAIYAIFLNTGQAYTASQITALTERAGRKWPLWSNRRAITNLTKKQGGEKLVKLPQMKIGPQGRPEHYYSLKVSQP